MRMVSLASMGNLSLDCVGMGSVSIEIGRAHV